MTDPGVARSEEWLAGAEAAIARVEAEAEQAKNMNVPQAALIMKALVREMKREFAPKPPATPRWRMCDVLVTNEEQVEAMLEVGWEPFAVSNARVYLRRIEGTVDPHHAF